MLVAEIGTPVAEAEMDLHALCAPGVAFSELQPARLAAAIAAGADVNARNATHSRTPLLCAVDVANSLLGLRAAPIVRQLLAAGADARACDGTNFGALSCAHLLPIDLVEALAKAGAPGDVMRKDTPAIVWAAAADDVAVARVLLRAGAIRHDRPENGPLPYIDLAVAGHALNVARSAGMVRLLVAHGASVHQRDRRGNPPLHIQEHADAMRALLDCGAVLEARNCLGETPLLRLGRLGPAERVACAKVLLEAGADPHARDASGEGLLDYPEVRLDPELRDLVRSAQAAAAARAALRAAATPAPTHRRTAAGRQPAPPRQQLI